jgi:nicotinate phosphoribosyltransferase
MTPDPPVSLWPDPAALGAVTDLYQLTMMAGYAATGMDRRRAVFELFVRRLPKGRAFLILAGLEQAIGDLRRLAFSREQVEAIRSWPAFAGVDPAWFEALASFRFEGDIWAIPEGSVVFAGEPLVRVEAPLPLAQLVETYLIASMSYATLVASKAARCVEVARGRPLYDFGTRRGHGPASGLICARASYLAGFEGTSNVEASRRLGIPCVGTMAHSWVQAFGDEAASFAAFASVFPGATLLVDTYDTEEGVRRAAAIEPQVRAVRIDSGDLGPLSRSARAILDASDREAVKIFGSGDLDEWKVRDLLESGAPIDAFGIGTELITSRDAPALSMVYKLVELDGAGRIKLSPGKKTYPMAKQVHRFRDTAGRYSLDRVTRADEPSDGEPLLVPVVHNGGLVSPLPTLDVVRAHCRAQLESLPDPLRGPDAPALYPMAYSLALEHEAEKLGVR